MCSQSNTRGRIAQREVVLWLVGAQIERAAGGVMQALGYYGARRDTYYPTAYLGSDSGQLATIGSDVGTELIEAMKKHLLLLIFYLLLAAPVAHGAEPAYELGFSPNGKALQVILHGIADAKESILVAAYSFTSKPVSEALLAAHKRGVKVAVVADQKGNSGKYTAVNFLANHKVPVRLNGRYAILHHKFMVIDGAAVQLGSFNYSASAVDKNAENVLLLKDVPGIAAKYAAEWKRLWGEGVDVKANY